MIRYVDFVFDCAPGPKRPEFVEVHDETGASIELGEWVERSDGKWALRVPALGGPKPDDNPPPRKTRVVTMRVTGEGKPENRTT